MLAGRLPAMLPKSLGEARALSARWYTRPVWLLTLFALCFICGLVYHLVVLGRQEPAALLVRGLYHAVVLAGFAALWQSISHYLRKRTLSPTSVLWTTVLTGILTIAATLTVRWVGPPELPEISETSMTLVTVLRMHATALIEVGFVFFLLVRLRQLVLFKRTRRSQRNWYLMLGLITVAGLSTLVDAPEDDIGVLQAVFIVPAVAFMVINAFRLSWIIFLTFREKMACMGLSLALLILLSALTDGIMDGGPYLSYYSAPLRVFLVLSISFGVLYSLTALLSLLFHLPTTSDFQRKADEMAAVHGLTHLVSQAFDAQKLTATIATLSVEAGSAQSSWLVLTNPETLAPRVAGTHGIHADEVERQLDLPALYREVARSRAPLVLDEAPADHRVHARPGQRLGSLLAVPLVARNQVLGVLFAAKDVSHGFEDDDVETVRTLGAQAALALDHAQLFEEQLEKERLARELAIAREVQHKLLPSRLPTLPGLSLHASSVPAQEVGGDYYDFIQLDEDRMAFIVADVSGKGTSAAFYMAEMQGVFQSGSRLASTPAQFLTHANEALAGALEKRAFISVIYGMIDRRREELVLARAGHCPAAAINLHGDARYLRPQGLGLGLDRGALFRRTLTEERVPLHPGDAYVLYTDGVVESRGPAGEEYGYDRLLQSLRTHRHEEASDLHDALLHDLQGFTGHEGYDDDMTLVVMKWHGVVGTEPASALVSEPHAASPDLSA